MAAIMTPSGEQTGDSAGTHAPRNAHERAFDALTRIAGFVCDSPIGAIVLDDGNRPRLASTHGLNATPDSVLSFCAALPAGTQEIFDLLASERLRGDALVAQPPGVRGCARVVLNGTAGLSIGS